MTLADKTNGLLALIREGAPMSLGQRLRLTVRLSVPAVIAQLSSIIMQYIDAAMVGRLGATQSAAVGLVLGVLMPSFHWTSETAVIKQSPFCLLAMLLSWGAALALFAGTAALSHRMPPAVSLSLACLLLAGADALALRWLKTKGAARFETT